MSPEQIVQRYFDAWNAQDAAAIVATFAPGGTYVDPTTRGPLAGDAIGEYARRLWGGFPDLKFEMRTHASSGEGLLAAQWVMRGTNAGPFGGLPPTGRPVVLEGADFILVDKSGIRSVTGYFDSGEVPRQLGLQVLVQPESIGPFTFGNSVRVAGQTSEPPGAFSITSLQTRSATDVERVSSYSREIAAGMPRLKGFLGWVGAVIGDRMLTITAWQTPEDPRQLMKEGPHVGAARAFFGPDLAAGGWTSVWVPHRMNPIRVRCSGCGKMTTRERPDGRCECGAALAPVPAYW